MFSGRERERKESDPVMTELRRLALQLFQMTDFEYLAKIKQAEKNVEYAIQDLQHAAYGVNTEKVDAAIKEAKKLLEKPKLDAEESYPNK